MTRLATDVAPPRVRNDGAARRRRKTACVADAWAYLKIGPWRVRTMQTPRPKPDEPACGP